MSVEEAYKLKSHLYLTRVHICFNLRFTAVHNKDKKIILPFNIFIFQLLNFGLK